MGLVRLPGTMPDGFTPACNSCGVCMCWDISEDEAEDMQGFWDSWVCQDCNGGEPMSISEWVLKEQT